MKHRFIKRPGLFVGVLVASVLMGQAFAQQSYTFTNAGATGILGPSQTQVNNAYNSTNLNGAVTVIGNGVQQWTVPVTGGYGIRAVGASGGSATATCPNAGGLGTDMYGEFNLTQGQVLLILVGQQGSPSTNSQDGGGGGGTYVTTSASVAMVVAGGGGGSTNNIGGCTGATRDGLHASITTNGTNGANGLGAGGTNGNGGTGTGGGAGGGFLTNGTGGGPTSFGLSFMNGGAGGTYNTAGPGGFGGGGSGYWEGGNGGGGGGYSGGGTNSGSPYSGGGGGGSYNSGTNQTNVQATAGHGRVIITRLCDVAVYASSNPICEGAAVTLSTNAGSSIVWSHGPTTQSVSVSPQTTTTYSVSGVSSSTSACASTVVITVTVNPLPDVSVVAFPQLVCAGGEAELTASGAQSFTWTAGPVSPTMTATPQATSVYTVTGESIHGCLNTQTVEVLVNTNVVSLPSTATMCAGGSATLVAGGLVTHTWSTGSHFGSLVVSPGTNTVYTVTGHDPNGCQLNAMVSVNVASGPALSVTGNQQVCMGEPATLTASGADSYFWSTNETTQTITQVLLVDVPHGFTVTGTGANGCSTTDVFTVLVSKCQALNEEGTDLVSVFPNPTSGEVKVEMNSTGKVMVRVTDITGKLVLAGAFEGNGTTIDLTGLDRGVYYMSLESESESRTIRLIRQ